MATTILVIGESGTGKSTSIRTLKPSETFLINVLDKALPFKGWRSSYKKINGKDGNLYSSDNFINIKKCIDHVNSGMPHIKVLVIDDFQYVMANEFMRRASESGWVKFTEIAQHAWELIISAQKCREDLNIFFLSHSEIDAVGKTKCKTIGRMLDEKITIEGMFTIVLSTVIKDDKYYFQTKNDGSILAKTPLEMFEDKLIPNDLNLVNETINSYGE